MHLCFLGMLLCIVATAPRLLPIQGSHVAVRLSLLAGVIYLVLESNRLPLCATLHMHMPPPENASREASPAASRAGTGAGGSSRENKKTLFGQLYNCRGGRVLHA